MKKIWNTIKAVLSWLLIIFTLCVVMFTVISLRTVDARQRNIFGYRLMIVQSDSMSSTDFSAGDLIFVREVDPATLQPGDIIAFISRNSHNSGETVTHKIRSLTEDENGGSGFITYGTTTDTDDEAIVRYSDVLGIYVGRIKNMGLFFAFLKTPKGYILFIMIPMLLLIFFSLFNCIRMFTGAQKQVEQEHRAAVEVDRQKMEQMRRELEELRALVLANGAAAPQKPGETPGKTSEAPQKAAQPQQKAEAPAKKPAPPGAAGQDKAAPAKRAASAKAADRKQDPAPAKKPGRFAASGDRKHTALPERKPTAQPNRPEDYDELALENIVAEYRPRRNKSL